MITHPIVKYGNGFWILEKVENGIATLWRNGERKEVDASEITSYQI